MPEATPAAPVEPAKPRSPAERIAAALTRAAGAEPEPEPPKTETPPAEPAKTEPKPEDKASRRFADIVRREGLLVHKQRKLAERQAAVDARAKELESIDSAVKRAKVDPLGALKALGLSYEDVTKVVLADGKPTPELEQKALREELDEFKSETQKQREADEKAAKEAEAKEMAQARADFAEECKSAIDSQAANFPLIRMRGRLGDVVALCEEFWKRNKRHMPILEAAAMVEKYWQNHRQKEDEALGLRKPEASKPPVAQPREAPKPPARTSLTADLAAETPDSFRQRNKTVAERRNAALALLG